MQFTCAFARAVVAPTSEKPRKRLRRFVMGLLCGCCWIFTACVSETVDPAAIPDPLQECPPRILSPLPLPRHFPVDFPLPPDMKIWKATTAELEPNHPRVQIVAYVPLSLEASEQWLNEALPRMGYTLGTHDAEDNEIESVITSSEWRGNWWLTSLRDCPSTTKWVVQLIKR